MKVTRSSLGGLIEGEKSRLLARSHRRLRHGNAFQIYEQLYTISSSLSTYHFPLLRWKLSLVGFLVGFSRRFSKGFLRGSARLWDAGVRFRGKRKFLTRGQLSSSTGMLWTGYEGQSLYSVRLLGLWRTPFPFALIRLQAPKICTWQNITELGNRHYTHNITIHELHKVIYKASYKLSLHRVWCVIFIWLHQSYRVKISKIWVAKRYILREIWSECLELNDLHLPTLNIQINGKAPGKARRCGFLKAKQDQPVYPLCLFIWTPMLPQV